MALRDFFFAGLRRNPTRVPTDRASGRRACASGVRKIANGTTTTTTTFGGRSPDARTLKFMVARGAYRAGGARAPERGGTGESPPAWGARRRAAK